MVFATPRFLPETGGVETHVREVARRLAARPDVDVSIITTDNGASLPEEETVAGVRVYRLRARPRGRDWRYTRGFGAMFDRLRPDLVHVQSYHTLVAPQAMLACRRARIPYVLTFHAGGHSSVVRSRVRPLQRRLLRPLLAGAERLIVLAPFEIEEYGDRLGIPRRLFTEIANGADLSEPPPGGWPVPEDDLIVSIGRVERYKGHHRVLAALPHILRRRPEARLWIAGTGSYETELHALAEKLGVQARVEIRAIPPDRPRELAEELSKARLVMLLSDFETQPIAVLEAAALGKPLLVSDAPGLSELGARGIARTISLASPPELVAAAAVQELDSAPERRTPVRLPTWDDAAEALLEVYRDVCGRRP